MGFRIHRGIFQKLNAERTAYENTFKIDDDGRIKEVDSEGNVTAGYLKVGEQASDADTVDGIQAGSFLRSDAHDSFSGNLTATANDWYIYGLGTRGASAGAYGIGNRNDDAYRQMTFHVPNQAAYSSSGTIPSFGWYSNGAVELMKLNSDSGNLWLKGSSEFDGRVYADNGVHVRGDWLRVNGSNGIYFESYGGGWRMSDTSWIRAYNDKHIYTGGNIEVGGTIRANGNGFYVDSTNVINSSGQYIADIANSTTNSRYFIQNAHGNPRNNLGDPTVTEMALFDSQFRCMTDLSNNYTNLDRLTFWVQQNEGDPWTEVTHSDTNKKRFLRTNSSGVVIPNRAYKFRVEFKAPGYVFANALYFYWSSNSHSTKVHVYKYNASQDTWHAHATSNTNVSSWPGHLYLPFSTIPWHETHTTSTGHHRYIRVEFIPNWSTGSYADRDINLYGGQIWGGYPSGRRTVHSINEDGNYYFPANLYAEGGSGDGNRLATRSWVTSTAKAADANLLDGINSTSFLRSDAADTASSKITFTAAESIELSGIRGRAVGSQTGDFIHLYERVNIGYPNGWGGQAAPSYGLSTHGGAQFNVGNVSNAPFTFNGSTIWHAGNDGSGSGLDADTVDGYHASRLFRIDSATRSGANFTDLIPSANETFLKELHQIETGVDYPAGAYTYGLLQSTKMTSMKFQWYVPHTASRGDNNTTDTIYFRTGWGGSQIYDWKYLIHSGNIAGQSVNYATTAGTANAVTWANVSGKPSSFNPSNHSHGIGGIDDAPRWWNNFGDNHTTRTSFDAENSALTTGFGWRYVQGSTNGPGTSTSPNQYYALTVGLGNDYNYDNYGMQLVIPRNTATPYISVRFEESRSLGAWQKISAGYADTAGSANAVAWDNVSGKPSTFAPSSHNHDSRYYTETEMDTKLAAKANSSHTHSYNDLTDLPTIPSNNNQLTNGAGYITGSGNTSGYAGQLSDRGGYGNNSFSFNQESGTFAGYTGWANYFIGNHGDGATYYNTVHIMPFWGVPQYSRLEGGTFRGPWTYWTTENMSQSTVNTWNTAYGWGDHSTAGYVTSVTDALGYTPYQEGTALSTTTISATNKISLNGGHSTARVVIKYNHNGDDTSENSGNLVMWTSEPGISYASSGIGGNIHESGHYYGKRNANIPYGVALRFNVASGRAEFLMTNSTNNGSFGVGWYVDDRGNTVQQGSITAPGYNNGNWDTAYGWGNHASAGYLTSVPNIDASKITSGTLGTARIPNLAASKITSGTFANARISQSSVTQHQGALSIAASQVTGLSTGIPAFEEGNDTELSIVRIDFSPSQGAAIVTLSNNSTYRLGFAR